MTDTPEAATPFLDERTDGPGVSRIDPADPAAPIYRVISKLRSPLALRDIMIRPVRTGYIGQDQSIDPKSLPPSAAELYPEVEVVELDIPTPAGPMRAWRYTAPGSDAPRPLMLYLHGGGFTVGGARDTDYITSRIARETGTIVVSVSYRLAPEWPFPAGLDDAAAAFRWLRAAGASIGGDPARISVAGDSAGANLSAALPLKLRDEGERVPEAAILLCPVTDFVFEDHASFERLAPLGIVYDTAFCGFIRGAYAVHRDTWTHPYVSPARAELAGYPPALIVSGTEDPMIDDNRSFAGKLRAAGRDVEHFVREGMPHGYYFFPGVVPQGDEAFAAIAAFLKRTTG